MGKPKDKKPKKTYTLSTFAKKELRKQELGITDKPVTDKPIAEKSGTGLGDNTALLNEGLKNVSFLNRPVNTTTFEPQVTQQPEAQQPETTEQPQNNLLLYGQSGLPNSEVSTLLGSMLTGETQKNLYDNVSHSLNKMKEGAELFDSTPNVGLTPGNALAGIKFLNGLASLSFEPITVVNEVLNQNPVTKWLNKGAMLPFELADELYTLTQKGTDYAYEQITGNKPDRSDPLSQELDEFVRTANQLLIGGKAFHETGKFFKKGMPEVKEIKTTSVDDFENRLNEKPEVTEPIKTENEKKPYESPAIIIGEQPKESPAIDLGNKKQTFEKIVTEFDKELQGIEQKLSSGEITKQEFDELEKQYNETERRKKSWQKRIDDLKEEPKPIEAVEENKRPNNDELYSEENIKNPKYPDRTNEVTGPVKSEEVIPKTKQVEKPIEPTVEGNIPEQVKKEAIAVDKVDAQPEAVSKENVIENPISSEKSLQTEKPANPIENKEVKISSEPTISQKKQARKKQLAEKKNKSDTTFKDDDAEKMVEMLYKRLGDSITDTESREGYKNFKEQLTDKQKEKYSNILNILDRRIEKSDKAKDSNLNKLEPIDKYENENVSKPIQNTTETELNKLEQIEKDDLFLKRVEKKIKQGKELTENEKNVYVKTYGEEIYNEEIKPKVKVTPEKKVGKVSEQQGTKVKGENLLQQINKAVEDVKAVDINKETPTVIASRLKELGYEIDAVKSGEFNESFTAMQNRQRTIEDRVIDKKSYAYTPKKEIERTLRKVDVGELRIVFKDANGTYKIPIDKLNEFKTKLEKAKVYNEAKQTIKDALSKDSGISFGGLSKLGDLADPKVLKAVYDVANYHYGNFKDFSKKVIDDLGDWIKPHLRNLWDEINKDRTGLDAVTQGFPLSFKKKTEIIKDNIEKPQTEVRDISEILPTAKNKRAILASDIFTKGDKEAGKDVFNYDNFTESTQINELIRETATENKKAVDEQKRDVRTWAKTQEGADMLRAMGLDEKEFLKLTKDSWLISETVMAGSDIAKIAGQQLLDRIKALPKETDKKIALADDYIKYVAIVKQLKGLESESARAMNIIRKKSNADVQVKLDLYDELIKAGFDTTSLPDFASKTLEIVEPTYKDKFYYWWYNSMLSNPLTDVANITGNLSHFGFELMRNVVSQNPKDSRQMLRDMRQAHTEGVKQVKDIIKNGETADSKFDYNERRYGEAFQPTSKTGKRFKAILPTTRLAFEDAYFRNMFGAIRKNATLKEISKETGDPIAKVENLIKAIAHNPDLATLDKKFEIYQKHLNALEKYIDYGVFQTPLGEAGRNLQSGVNKLPPVKLIFPFIKIAVNIAKTGLRASPYGFKDLLKKDLTRLEKKDIISRAVTGSAFLAGLGYLISQDLIEVTGHGIDDKDKRELWHKQGYKENHFYMKINGEKYGFSYQNINPINIPLSIIGNLQDDAKYNRKKKEFDDSTTTRIIKSLLGMAETLTDQSFMQGISNLMRYVRDKDVEGLYKNAQNLFTPNILSLPRDIKNMTGNGKTLYETNDIESRFKDKIGMTEGLKPKLNQFGEKTKSTYERFPFMVSKQKSDDKLTDFLAENNIQISFPSKQTKLGDQTLSDSPETYYKYNKLSGERFKEELTKQLPELEKLKTAEEKDDAVHKIVNDVRKQIRKEMLGLPEEDKKKTKKHLNIPGRPNPDKDSERNSENKQTIKKHLIIPK